MLRFLFLLTLTGSNILAATWFVGATSSGANSGNSWANKWDIASVNQGSINPGDTLVFDRGSTGVVYSTSLVLNLSGTAGNLITIRPALNGDTGHDGGGTGQAIFNNATLTFGSVSEYIHFNGAKDPSFVAPTNHAQVTNGSTKISLNCGFWLKDRTGNIDSDTSPVYMFQAKDPRHLRVSYVEMSGLTNTICGAGCDWRGTAGYFNGDNTTGATDVVFEYLYLHGNTSQQFASIGVAASDWDSVVFKFGWIYWGGEDHFEVGDGWTVRDSVIGPVNGYGKNHADLFQITGNKVKIYNNAIFESGNAIFRLQTFGEGERSDFQFFNNIVWEQEGRAPGGGTLVEPGCFVNFDPLHPANTQTYNRILIANNTWYNSVSNLTVSPLEMCRNSALSWSKGDVSNCFVTNITVANNLFVDKTRGVGMPATTVSAGTNGYVVYTTNAVRWDYNIHASDPSKTRLVTPRMVSYLDVTTNVEVHPFKFHNETNYPAWVDPDNGNFELRTSDIAALNTGTNLSAFFNFDGLNRPRGTNWDRGAFELQYPVDGVVSGALVMLSFDEDYTTNLYIQDYSGNNNHAYRFGNKSMGPSVLNTNWPLRVLTSTVPGRSSDTGYGGSFDWFADGWGDYGRSGLYAAITNYSMFTNKNAMTIMCWAKYNAPHPTLDYSSDANACLITAGASTGDNGSWGLQRYNQNIHNNETRFIVITNVGFEYAVFNFPELGWEGTTTNWHHYAVTFNSGLTKTYFDGALVESRQLTITNLTVGHSNSRVYDWIGVGVDTHVGTPQLEDEFPFGSTNGDYPNNGWFNGVMDDLRIYNVAISSDQVQMIYLGTNNISSVTSQGTTIRTATTIRSNATMR